MFTFFHYCMTRLGVNVHRLAIWESVLRNVKFTANRDVFTMFARRIDFRLKRVMCPRWGTHLELLSASAPLIAKYEGIASLQHNNRALQLPGDSLAPNYLFPLTEKTAQENTHKKTNILETLSKLWLCQRRERTEVWMLSKTVSWNSRAPVIRDFDLSLIVWWDIEKPQRWHPFRLTCLLAALSSGETSSLKN